MNINLKATLSAYTKGILPTKLSELQNDTDFISDVPEEGIAYVREQGRWVNAEEVCKGTTVITEPNSGLNLVNLDKHTQVISIRKWGGHEKDLPTLEEDTTYYIIDNTPEDIINCGTAEPIDNSLLDIYDGGNANTSSSVTLLPLNSYSEIQWEGN